MRPFLIAEISSNHNNSLCRAKEMISIAHEVGFDAVKFQLFKIDQLFLCRSVRIVVYIFAFYLADGLFLELWDVSVVRSLILNKCFLFI